MKNFSKFSKGKSLLDVIFLNFLLPFIKKVKKENSNKVVYFATIYNVYYT